MTCQEFLARYSEYLDELVDPLEAARWRRHIEDCVACGRYDRVMRQGLELVRTLPRIEPSPDFAARLQHRLFHVRDEDVGERTSGASAVVALAIAGMLAAVAWSPLLRPDRFTIEVPEAPARVPDRTARASTRQPFALPAAWPDSRPVASESGTPGPRWQAWDLPPLEAWDLPPFEPGSDALLLDFVYSPFTDVPGPYSPLIVDHPDFGVAEPRVLGASATGGGGTAFGRE
ncbi:MAG TPA: hypothetical protein VF192_04525 [Longimicrobiales bacterium]